MDDTLLTLLRKYDTPTVSNAIEVAQGTRGYQGFTRGTPLCSDPEGGAVVGYARTAQIAGAELSPEPVDVIRARRMAYYRYMAEAPKPAVTVIEDMDARPVAAFWGEVNATIHKGFGISGVLTNGVMRDLGDLPKGFPIVAGSLGPSHMFAHVRAIDVQVTVFGMQVRPGDLIHADRHGAVVVPAAVIPKLAAAIQKLLDTEQAVLAPCREPGLDFAKFEKIWAAHEAART
jgi:regulator of RNase E activity RraA